MPLLLSNSEHVELAEEEVGATSDGFHTFAELYAHRVALFLALCRALGLGWKSWVHADGTGYPGWFIAGLTLPMVGDVTYHLPAADWEAADHLTTLAIAPAWDGHTPAQVVERLRMFATLECADG